MIPQTPVIRRILSAGLASDTWAAWLVSWRVDLFFLLVALFSLLAPGALQRFVTTPVHPHTT